MFVFRRLRPATDAHAQPNVPRASTASLMPLHVVTLGSAQLTTDSASVLRDGQALTVLLLVRCTTIIAQHSTALTWSACRVRFLGRWREAETERGRKAVRMQGRMGWSQLQWSVARETCGPQLTSCSLHDGQRMRWVPS